MTRVLLIAAASYLLGSIPFGYLLVRIFRGEDVRQSGSGNIGATNVSRKSPILGILTLLLDALKGSAAVWLAASLAHRVGDPAPYRLMALAALFAVVGHMFPVWLKFRGGKGVATALGSFLIIAPISVLVAAGIFAAVVLLFRYVSLGSIITALAFPVVVILRHDYDDTGLALAFMSLVSLLIVTKHRANIRRLLAGTEHRFAAKHLSSEEKGIQKP
jgi:acyl phosphate:glycerol-3-phosphate acyltransferase